MVDQVITNLIADKKGNYVDCTFGQGGYSKTILKHAQNKVIAIDRDNQTFNNAKLFIERKKR